MKTAFKKLFCLMLVAMLLVSAVPAAFASEGEAAETTTFYIEIRIDDENIRDSKAVEGFPADKVEDEAYIKAQAKKVFASYFEGREIVGFEQENTIGAAVYLKAKADNDNDRPGQRPGQNDNDRPGQNDNDRPGQNDNNRPGQRPGQNDNDRPGQNDNDRPGQNDNNRPGQNDNNRPGQNDNNRPGQNDNNRPGQNDNNRPGQNDNNRPGQNDNNRPGQNDDHNRPGFDDNDHGFGDKDHNRFPGNGHKHPNFKWETVELTVVYNFPDNFRHMGRTSETFKVWKGSDILDALAAAEDMGYYDVPTRDGYTLAGYSFDKACKNDVNRDDEINGDLTIYCEWEKSKVTLRVYTNEDSRYPDRTFSLDNYARDGWITREEVEDLLDSKYTAKKGYSLAYYGLFTDRTWDHGDYDKDDAVSKIDVRGFRGEKVVYVVVKNVKQSTADTTNPKTGDNIMIAVTTMTLAAVAVVSMVELKKRKMI